MSWCYPVMPGATPRSGCGASGSSVEGIGSGRGFTRGRLGASLGRGVGAGWRSGWVVDMPDRWQIAGRADGPYARRDAARVALWTVRVRPMYDRGRDCPRWGRPCSVGRGCRWVVGSPRCSGRRRSGRDNTLRSAVDGRGWYSMGKGNAASRCAERGHGTADRYS